MRELDGETKLLQRFMGFFAMYEPSSGVKRYWS